MPEIKFNCPKCNGEFTVDSSLVGRLAECSQCKTRIRIPNPNVSNGQATSPKSGFADYKASGNSGKPDLSSIKEPFYLRKWFMILTSIFLPYIAAPIMWIKKRYSLSVRVLVTIWAIAVLIAYANNAGSGINGKYVYTKSDPEITGIINISGSDCQYALVIAGGFQTGAYGTYNYDKQNKTIYFRWSEQPAPKSATVISENGSTALMLETGVIYKKE